MLGLRMLAVHLGVSKAFIIRNYKNIWLNFHILCELKQRLGISGAT